MNTNTILEAYRKKGFVGVRSSTMYEGNRRVDLIFAEAKRGTPVSQLSYTRTGTKPRVHIATFVPSTKRISTFSTRYAKKK